MPYMIKMGKIVDTTDTPDFYLIRDIYGSSYFNCIAEADPP